MSERLRPENKRRSFNFEFEVGGLRYTATFSRYPDGRISELFLSNHKSNSQADTNARDAAITFSIAIQRALCRDARGNASAALGAALDLLADGGRR